jgi:hypothetical protein
LASRPAASITLGLLVLVQLVMAAISTSPLPRWYRRPAACCAAPGAAASVGRFCSISPQRAGRLEGLAFAGGQPR